MSPAKMYSRTRCDGVEVAARVNDERSSNADPTSRLRRGATGRRCEGARSELPRRSAESVEGAAFVQSRSRTSFARARARVGAGASRPSRACRSRSATRARRRDPTRAPSRRRPARHRAARDRRSAARADARASDPSRRRCSRPLHLETAAARRSVSAWNGASRARTVVQRAARSLALDDVDRIGGQKRIASEPCRAWMRCRERGDTAGPRAARSTHTGSGTGVSSSTSGVTRSSATGTIVT